MIKHSKYLCFMIFLLVLMKHSWMSFCRPFSRALAHRSRFEKDTNVKSTMYEQRFSQFSFEKFSVFMKITIFRAIQSL